MLKESVVGRWYPVSEPWNVTCCRDQIHSVP